MTSALSPIPSPAAPSQKFGGNPCQFDGFPNVEQNQPLAEIPLDAGKILEPIDISHNSKSVSRETLYLNPRLSLGSGDLQWILYQGRHPIAFISSTRDILLRCILESGHSDATAVSIVSTLPATFAAFKAARTSSPAASNAPPIAEAA